MNTNISEVIDENSLISIKIIQNKILIKLIKELIKTQKLMSLKSRIYYNKNKIIITLDGKKVKKYVKNGCNKYINCEESCELCEECLQKVKKTIESLKTTKKGEPRLRGIE